MPKISSIDMTHLNSNINTIRTNYSSIQPNDTSKLWSTVTVTEQLEKVEDWGYKIAVNLVQSGDRLKNKPKRVLTVLSVTLFLYAFAFKALLCQIIISDSSKGLLLFFGDLTQFYGTAVNRLYFNSILIAYGFHAAFVYSLISRKISQDRDWVLRFDENWRKTYFRAPNADKKVVDNLARSVTTGVKVQKWSIECAVLASVLMTLYGGLTNFSSFDPYAFIYIGWSMIHVLWSLLATLVNMTALFHYFIFTRAIIIRFSEARLDFEYAIRSKPPAEAWVISKMFEKHYIVCDMVIGSNQHFKNYLFFFYPIMVCHECFLFYQLITVVNPLQVKGVVVIYIIMDAMQLLLVSICSAKITSMAHKPYHVVHGVGTMNLPEDTQVQAQLFVQRLSGGSVGMTILDGFVVTGGVLSSVLTGIVTYFSIIVEMK